VLNGQLTLFVYLSIMTLDDIPLLSMLKSRLGYLNQQQRSVSMNVANSDTPGYTPHDLESFAFHVQSQTQGAALGVKLAPVQTHAMHLAGKGQQPGSAAFQAQASPDSETRLDGNSVVLEEEMIKMGKARSDYDTALGFYSKSLSLIQLALRAPGKPS
jgi:flagellar basal-body rod protein FlgB